jgi:hypothetical protein
MEAHFRQDNQHVMNVHWFNSTDGETNEIALHQIANTYINWYNSDLRPLQSDTVQLYEVVCKELRPEGLAVLETSGLPSDGQKSEAPLPNSVTLAVHWGTGLIGRSTHGRTYFIGLCEDQVEGNDCAVAPAIQSAYDALRTTFDSALLGLEFSIVSFVHARAWRLTPRITPITGVAVEPTIDNMRRRLPGRGQ